MLYCHFRRHPSSLPIRAFFHSLHFNEQVYGLCWSWGWRLADTSEMELQWFSPCQGNPTHCCRPNPPGETKCLQTLYLCQVLFHLYSLPPQSFKKTTVSLGDWFTEQDGICQLKMKGYCSVPLLSYTAKPKSFSDTHLVTKLRCLWIFVSQVLN